jgi:hypothetical protein
MNLESLPTAASVSDHEILPMRGTAYSMAGVNTGLPATLTRSWDYPVEAICAGCGQMIRCERLVRCDWEHQGRMPGESAPSDR